VNFRFCQDKITFWRNWEKQKKKNKEQEFSHQQQWKKL